MLVVVWNEGSVRCVGYRRKKKKEKIRHLLQYYITSSGSLPRPQRWDSPKICRMYRKRLRMSRYRFMAAST